MSSNHMEWFIPSFRTKPWYEEFTTLINAIDATAYDHESRIDVLEHSGPGGHPYASEIFPVVEHLLLTGSLSNWKGKIFDNTGASGSIIITVNDTDVPNGSSCKFILTSDRNKITLKPSTGLKFILPNDDLIDSTGDGIRLESLLTEIELLKEISGSQTYFRLLVNSGEVSDLDNEDYIYKSTDISSPKELLEYYVIPKIRELTGNITLSDWNGSTLQNTGATVGTTVSISSEDVNPGCRCRIIQTHGTYHIGIVSTSGVLLELPDGVLINTTDDLRSQTLGSELELLLYIDDSHGIHVRVIIKKGSWRHTAGTGSVYYPSTDTKPEIDSRLSTEPVTRYVKTTGSDSNDGKSWGNAYASINKAYQDIPEIRLHECKILIEAGDYTSAFPKLIESNDRESGSLSIVGVGEPRHVSGPHTVASTVIEGDDLALVITVTGATWTVNELIGKFILLKSGDSVDTANRIIRNTADTITISCSLDYYPVVATDTFDIVTPAVKITLPINKAFSIRYNSNIRNLYNTTDYGNRSSSLAFHNVWFDISNSGDTECESIEIISDSISGVYFDFCRIDIYNAADGNQFIDLFNTKINPAVHPPLSIDYIVDGETGITNICTPWGTYVGLVITNNDISYLSVSADGFSSIESTTIEGGLRIGIFDTPSFLGILLDVNYIEIYKGILELIMVNISGITIADKALTAFDSIIVLNAVHFYRGSNAIYLRRSCRVSAEILSCDSVETKIPLHMGGCNSYTFKGSHSAFIGSSTAGDKAYRMFAPATDVKSDTWPASNGTGVNDALGSFITRCD